MMFWAMNVAIAASGGALVLVLRSVLERMLNDEAMEEDAREVVNEFSR